MVTRYVNIDPFLPKKIYYFVFDGENLIHETVLGKIDNCGLNGKYSSKIREEIQIKFIKENIKEINYYDSIADCVEQQYIIVLTRSPKEWKNFFHLKSKLVLEEK